MNEKENLSEYKTKLLEILKVFDAFCRKHNLKYSISGGTLLGAVRHGGFIPWDDDIDVMMIRSEYDKFIELSQKEMDNGYEVMSLHTHPGYCLRFAKLIDKNTTLIEFEKNPYLLGAYVDIFPMDGIPNDEKVYRNQAKRFNRYWKAVYHWYTSRGNKGLRFIAKKAVARFWSTSEYDAVLKADKIALEHTFEDTRDVTYWGGYYGHRDVYERSIYERYKTIEFEGMNVMCVEKVEYYLTRLFGDYMKLPPKEKQVTHHYCHFLDLNRRWTEEELKAKGIIK